MKDKYIVTGKLTDVRTVSLDESLPLENVKVRMVIEPLESTSPRPYPEVMQEIRQRQHERGHTPSAKEDIDAYINAERDGWGR